MSLRKRGVLGVLGVAFGRRGHILVSIFFRLFHSCLSFALEDREYQRRSGNTAAGNARKVSFCVLSHCLWSCHVYEIGYALCR